MQERLRKFQRFEDNCTRYMPFFDSVQPAQNLVPVCTLGKAVDSVNKQWLQNMQSVKGIVVGKKSLFPPPSRVCHFFIT